MTEENNNIETETNVYENETYNSLGIAAPTPEESNLAQFPTQPEAAPQPPPPAFTLGLDPIELLTVNMALRVLLRHQSQQDPEPLESIERVTHLLRVIRQDALVASKMVGTVTGAQ